MIALLSVLTLLSLLTIGAFMIPVVVLLALGLRLVPAASREERPGREHGQPRPHGARAQA